MGEQVVWPTIAGYTVVCPMFLQHRPSHLRGLLFEVSPQNTEGGDTKLVPVAEAKEAR